MNSRTRRLNVPRNTFDVETVIAASATKSPSDAEARVRAAWSWAGETAVGSEEGLKSKLGVLPHRKITRCTSTRPPAVLKRATHRSKGAPLSGRAFSPKVKEEAEEGRPIVMGNIRVEFIKGIMSPSRCDISLDVNYVKFDPSITSGSAI